MKAVLNRSWPLAAATRARNASCVYVAPLSTVAWFCPFSRRIAVLSSSLSGRAMSTFLSQPPLSRWYSRTLSAMRAASPPPYHASGCRKLSLQRMESAPGTASVIHAAQPHIARKEVMVKWEPVRIRSSARQIRLLILSSAKRKRALAGGIGRVRPHFGRSRRRDARWPLAEPDNSLRWADYHDRRCSRPPEREVQPAGFRS